MDQKDFAPHLTKFNHLVNFKSQLPEITDTELNTQNLFDSKSEDIRRLFAIDKDFIPLIDNGMTEFSINDREILLFLLPKGDNPFYITILPLKDVQDGETYIHFFGSEKPSISTIKEYLHFYLTNKENKEAIRKDENFKTIPKEEDTTDFMET